MTVSLGEAPARGENALKPPSPVALTCDVKGTPALAKGASLFESAESGPESASFGGIPVGLNVLGFPASAAQGRIKVRTTNGVRIDGWLDTAELPLYAAVDLPVLPGHLWIAQGERLSFFAASSKVTVEAALDGSVAQKIRVESPCSALALEPRSRAAWDIPGSARGYVPRHPDLALRQEPGAQVAYTLKVKDPATSMLLWSTEARDGYVRVLLHRDIVIDAWVSGERPHSPEDRRDDGPAGPAVDGRGLGAAFGERPHEPACAPRAKCRCVSRLARGPSPWVDRAGEPRCT